MFGSPGHRSVMSDQFRITVSWITQSDRGKWTDGARFQGATRGHMQMHVRSEDDAPRDEHAPLLESDHPTSVRVCSVDRRLYGDSVDCNTVSHSPIIHRVVAGHCEGRDSGSGTVG